MDKHEEFFKLYDPLDLLTATEKYLTIDLFESITLEQFDNIIISHEIPNSAVQYLILHIDIKLNNDEKEYLLLKHNG